MDVAYAYTLLHHGGVKGTTLIKFMSLSVMINAIVRSGYNLGPSKRST